MLRDHIEELLDHRALLGFVRDKVMKENSTEPKDKDRSNKHTDDGDRRPAKKPTLNINFIREGQEKPISMQVEE